MNNEIIITLEAALAGSEKDIEKLLSLIEFKQLKTEEIVALYDHVMTSLRQKDGNYFFIAALLANRLQPTDFSDIHSFLDKGIALGSARCMGFRAFMHQKGRGGPVNPAAAIALYNNAIELNDGPAINGRAVMHLNGLGGPVNYEAAIALYEKAIALNNTNAMRARADMHNSGEGCPINHAEAIALYERAIALNDPIAMNARANMHKKGQGGPIDLDAAIALYDKAIKLGNSFAMRIRANMYYLGEGEKNLVAAAALYDKAIELNDPIAMRNRAVMYVNEKEMPANYNRAANLFIKSMLLCEKSQRIAIINFIKNHFAEFPPYAQFKIYCFIPELTNTKHSLFSFLTKNPKTNLLNQKSLLLLECMATDREMPIPYAQQLSYCTFLIEKIPDLEKQIKSPEALALISKVVYKSFAENFNKNQIKKALAWFQRIPKNTQERLDACNLLAQKQFFDAKAAGKSLEEAYHFVKPLLDEAVAAGDISSEQFSLSILDEINNPPQPPMQQII